MHIYIYTIVCRLDKIKGMEIEGQAGTTRRNKGDSEREVLVGVRVPENFHRRIQSQCRRRELSLKELVIDALKLYFRTPRTWDVATMTFNEYESEDDAAEKLAWSKLWTKYINRMPREKIEIMSREMEWDLDMLRRSRVRVPSKAARKRPVAKEHYGKKSKKAPRQR